MMMDLENRLSDLKPKELSEMTHTPSKSLMRMLGPKRGTLRRAK